ncbi:MAG: hypothetical protein ACM3PY_21305 [Omnitrophica WOR_2 bacterium]
MTETETQTQTPTVLYCANHPQTETTLRCNRCNKPICTKCAVLTPTGYRCKECVRGQQKAFETARWYDYPIAFILAGILSFLGSLVASRLGFFIIFLAPIAGGIVAEAVRFAVGRRRSKRLLLLATLGAASGSLLPVLSLILFLLAGMAFSGAGGMGFLLQLIWPAVYAFLVTSTVYYRLGGITMR